MGYEIYGLFDSSHDAAAVAEKLGLKGVKMSNITIFVNAERREEIDRKADVKVEDDKENHEKKDLLNKMKKMFNKSPDTEKNTNMYEEMLSYGLGKEQALRYFEEVKSGKILVLADPEPSMGMDPAKDDTNLYDPVFRGNE